MKTAPTLTINCEEREIEQALIWDCRHFLGLKFLKNQVRTPIGIIDVVAAHPYKKGVYYVIELKRDLLDESAFVQCMRYTNYLNTNHNKDGKRLFIPFLIGKNISPKLFGAVKHYDIDDQHDYDIAGYCLYTLFAFDLRKGLDFSYFNNDQFEYYCEHLHTDNSTYFHRRISHYEERLIDNHYETVSLQDRIKILEDRLCIGDYNA
ncbi:hypothetical protein LZD49_33565 [Dyadobacter sp. CY261]|uniref:hypothetical protein n=1 Tax=Dyadobacter sp. CY261 TaxID=2907203 RepID=UPI001F3C116E|nr:hypothetical protein [Dyadobacter sp. CY261]MCF0075456.1 hypothetical protein [Dyadobacter sp. CY261]